MAVVYQPGVAQVTLRGMIGFNPWAVVLHWQPGGSTAAWTQSDLDLLTTTCFTAWTSNLRTLSGNNVALQQSVGVDIGSGTGRSSLYTPTQSVGGGANPLEPSSLATVIQCRIPARYRGGHPRLYWPMLTYSDMATEATWTTAKITSSQNAMAAYVGAVRGASYSFGSSTLNHVIPRYTYAYHDDPVHHKYTKERTGPNGAPTVASYFTNPTAGSQRRRLVP